MYTIIREHEWTTWDAGSEVDERGSFSTIAEANSAIRRLFVEERRSRDAEEWHSSTDYNGCKRYVCDAWSDGETLTLYVKWTVSRNGNEDHRITSAAVETVFRAETKSDVKDEMVRIADNYFRIRALEPNRRSDPLDFSWPRVMWDDAYEEIKDEHEETLKEVILAEMRENDEDLREELKEEIMYEHEDELRKEVKQEILDEDREELSDEIREEIREENDQDLRAEVNEEMREDLEEELKIELRRELKEELIKDEVNHLTEENRTFLRQKARDRLFHRYHKEATSRVKARMNEPATDEIKELLHDLLFGTGTWKRSYRVAASKPAGVRKRQLRTQ